MADIRDGLDRAKDALERRLDEVAETHAGRPQADVLDALDRAVREAGVTPHRADLSALAHWISRGRPVGG